MAANVAAALYRFIEAGSEPPPPVWQAEADGREDSALGCASVTVAVGGGGGGGGGGPLYSADSWPRNAPASAARCMHIDALDVLAASAIPIGLGDGLPLQQPVRGTAGSATVNGEERRRGVRPAGALCT